MYKTLQFLVIIAAVHSQDLDAIMTDIYGVTHPEVATLRTGNDTENELIEAGNATENEIASLRTVNDILNEATIGSGNVATKGVATRRTGNDTAENKLVPESGNVVENEVATLRTGNDTEYKLVSESGNVTDNEVATLSTGKDSENDLITEFGNAAANGTASLKAGNETEIKGPTVLRDGNVIEDGVTATAVKGITVNYAAAENSGNETEKVTESQIITEGLKRQRRQTHPLIGHIETGAECVVRGQKGRCIYYGECDCGDCFYLGNGTSYWVEAVKLCKVLLDVCCPGA